MISRSASPAVRMLPWRSATGSRVTLAESLGGVESLIEHPVA